jgi:3-hydroxy-9,10-secoandrosta-1,3,5(10)-triene-9,17-dione monooxygenase reductase component
MSTSTVYRAAATASHTESPVVRPLGDFRHALGHFCSSVTILTSNLDGNLSGMTCQSFFSLSLDPPLIAFAPSLFSRSYAQIRQGSSVCVNILSAEQEASCRQFASSKVDKFDGIAWSPAPSGCPIIEGALGWLDCSIEREQEAGDHWLVVARVNAFSAYDRKPLLFFQGGFHALS